MSKLKGDSGYRAGWCIHFRSMGHHDTCEAGVSYDSFTGADMKFDRRPCFIKPGEDPASRAPCEHLRPPTTEEIAAHEEWQKGRLDKLRTVMIGIAPWRKANKWKNHREVVECPACKGRLHLSIAACNGHMHGMCETDGCVSWME